MKRNCDLCGENQDEVFFYDGNLKMRAGGKVYTAAIGESAYNPTKQYAFVINNNTHKTKQGWKEGKTK